MSVSVFALPEDMCGRWGILGWSKKRALLLMVQHGLPEEYRYAVWQSDLGNGNI
jgi:hypothetical protein